MTLSYKGRASTGTDRRGVEGTGSPNPNSLEGWMTEKRGRGTIG